MKKSLSSIASCIQASPTLTIDTMYKKMKADGLDVIGFGAGEPDFDTPENIKAAAHRAIDENCTRYTPAAGIDKLKAAVCDVLARECGLDYKPGQIVISNGAKHSLSQTIMCLCDPGDEVILPAPYWVSYYEMIRMAGAVPVIVDCGQDTGFKMTAEMFEKAVTPKTKLMVLCTPSNPTGCVYSREELAGIAEVCVKNGIYVISDEIYYQLIYGGSKHTSIASLGEEIKDLTITVNGVSKSYAMTGWRIGYIAAAGDIADAVSNYQSHSASAPNSIAQMAALEALTGQQEGVEQMRRAFEKRRDYIVSRLRAMGARFIYPDGAFYVMIDLSKFLNRPFRGRTLKNADDFARFFLEQELVAVVPCTGFAAPEYIRFSYATSIENIEEGINRLEHFLNESDE